MRCITIWIGLGDTQYWLFVSVFGQDDMLFELVENGLSVQAQSTICFVLYKYSA